MRPSLLISLVMLLVLSASAQNSRFSSEGKFLEPSSTARPGLGPLSSENALGAFDVINYHLALDLAMTDEMLQGRMTILLKLVQSADSIRLHAVGLTLDTVLVDNLVAGLVAHPESEEVAIALGGLRDAGDTLVVEISYRRLPGLNRPSNRLGYYFYDTSLGIPANLGYTMAEPSDARFWMPCFDEPWDKATSEIVIRVPRDYIAVSNGRLLSVQTDTDGSLLWHWKEEHQIATYLMCVTASRFTISTLPFARDPNDTIPLHYVVWEEDSAQCAAYLPTVHDMMSAFSALFGPYPFDQYGMAAVTPFAFGGMEHQTMTTLHRAYRTNDGVVVHELAHQWWGDLVTCGTWRDIWLNESFATYGEALWAEWQGGATALKEDMTRKLTFQYGSWEGAIYDPVAQGFSLFANSVYSKGAWVLHTLRGVLGDTLFYRMLATYRQKFAERTAITDDLRAVVDSLTGESYAWFFDQWVYGRGWPQYALQFGSSVDTLEVTIYQLQPSSWPTYRMPIQLRLQGATQETTLVVWNSQRTESFRLPSPFPVLSVDLDPDGWILKELRDPPLAVDATTQPAGFRLLQNYPNPFNPTTVIRYELPSSHHVQLAVYDLLGREVARLVDEDQSRGSYAVQFGGDGLAAGLYLYKIRATPLEGNANGEYSAARKMVLVK